MNSDRDNDQAVDKFHVAFDNSKRAIAHNLAQNVLHPNVRMCLDDH
jgi:hypothetical protein